MIDAKTVKARKFVADVKNMARKRGLNVFVVTDGASATLCNNSDAVRHARDCHIQWEQEHGYDPYENWNEDLHLKV